MVAAADANGAEVVSISIDRTRRNAIEAPGTFTVTDDFLIELGNEAEPIHVHLTCDDDLAPSLDLETGNHYLHREGTRQIPVEVLSDDRPVRGRLQVSVGYGAETDYVELRVVEPSIDDTVRVDTSLADPQPASSAPPADEPMQLDPVTFGSVGIAIAAVIGAIVVVGVYTEAVISIVLAAAFVATGVGVYVLRNSN